MSPIKFSPSVPLPVALMARAVARVVSLFRPLHLHAVGLEETGEGRYSCPTVSHQTAAPAVFLDRPAGMPWRRLDAWIERDAEAALGCVHLDALGWALEVWFVRIRGIK